MSNSAYPRRYFIITMPGICLRIRVASISFTVSAVCVMSSTDDAVSHSTAPKYIFDDFFQPTPCRCDRLLIEGKSLYVNAGWLAELSTYFQSAFFSPHCDEITLSNEFVYEDVLELLRVVFYCPRRKPITVANIALILRMAHNFGMQTLVERCEDFICRNIDSLNRIRLLQLTCALAQCDRTSSVMALLIEKLSMIKENELSTLHFSEIPGDVVADVFASRIKRNRQKKKHWCC